MTCVRRQRATFWSAAYSAALGFVVARAWCQRKTKAVEYAALQNVARARLRQHRLAHQPAIAFACGTAAFVDRPHHEALPTPHVARGEDVRQTRLILAILCPDIVRAVGQLLYLDAELFEELILRTEKSHRKQHQLRRQHFFGAGYLLHRESAIVPPGPFDADGVDFLDVAVFIADKFFRADEILARVVAEDRSGFLLAVVEFVDLGPLRPRIVGSAFHRRFRQNLELRQALAAVAHRGADAVRAGIAATDHNDVLALRGGVV